MITKVFFVALALIGLTFGSPAAAPVPASGTAGALVAAGGGAGSFSTVRAFGSILGDDAVQRELIAIRNRSTTRARDQFIQVFDFAVSDAWTRAGQDNVTVPDSSQRGRDLGLALYNAGMQGGGFSGDFFFATLFTSKVWSDVKRDIDAKFGAGTSETFTGNVGAMFSDVDDLLAAR